MYYYQYIRSSPFFKKNCHFLASFRTLLLTTYLVVYR
nr:MAG TPA: hypothetical protein [Caudoviricetes sp.]